MALWQGDKIPEWFERLEVSLITEYRDSWGKLIASSSRPSHFEAYRIWPENPNLRRLVKLGEKYP